GEPIRIADVGTGTGCLALALAKALPAAEVTATDLSTDALDLAQENAEALGLAGRITFVSGDGLAPVAGQTFDWLVSNPPYIPDAEWDEVAPNVRDHEPELALRGGHDGLAVLRPVLEGAASVLVPGGWLMVEAAASNAAAAADLARAGGLVEVELIHDFEGHPRFVLAQRTASSV
ncbi:MAG: HemK/PrmC family methyltransferase, partial [Planctomycetota bacterium]